MMRKSRISEIEMALTTLVKEGDPESSFIIFENPQTEKFVQFAFLGDGLVCDIPLQELSKDEENAIKSIMEEKATNARTDELISYQKWFNVTELNKAAEFVETIFTKVFKLPEDYTIKTEFQK
jgi:hypothetical protein